MPGILGSDSNTPLIDPGTLSRTAAPVPGAAGGGRFALAHATEQARTVWKTLETLREWGERVEHYAHPDTRVDQLAKDAVDLPLKLLKLLGLEVESIPLLPMWKAEIEFMIKLLVQGSRAEARAAQARRQWEDAVRIAQQLGSRATQAADSLRAPDQEPFVSQWDAIVRWHQRHGNGGLASGYFLGPGFGFFRVSSIAELRELARACRGRIYGTAVRAGLSYCLLRIQQGSIARLAAASESSLEGMMESRAAIDRMVGAWESIAATLGKEEAMDGAAANPVAHVAAPMQRLQDLAALWLQAGEAVHRHQPVRN